MAENIKETVMHQSFSYLANPGACGVLKLGTARLHNLCAGIEKQLYAVVAPVTTFTNHRAVHVARWNSFRSAWQWYAERIYTDGDASVFSPEELADQAVALINRRTDITGNARCPALSDFSKMSEWSGESSAEVILSVPEHGVNHMECQLNKLCADLKKVFQENSSGDFIRNCRALSVEHIKIGAKVFDVAALYRVLDLLPELEKFSDEQPKT